MISSVVFTSAKMRLMVLRVLLQSFQPAVVWV